MEKKALKRFCLSGVLLMVMGVWPINVLAQENDKLENNTSAKAVNQETDVGSVVNLAAGEVVKNEPAKEMAPETPAKAEDSNPAEVMPENSVPAESEVVEERLPVAESFEVLSDVDDFQAFAPRFSTPGTNNPCYFADNIFYQSGYGLPNCTAYAWGRAYELLGRKPNLSSGNANQWWGYNVNQRVYSCGQTPKLGAIACWSGSACGHVAVVEAISDDRVTISESGWNSFLFRNSSYSIGSENSIYSGSFQGYIYIGDFSNETTGASVTDAAANDNDGDAAPTAMITDVTAPTISAVEITDVSANGYTIKCRVTDDTGVDRVMFPTWTNANGQDDLDIPEKSETLCGTMTGDVVTYRVKRSEHYNEWGEYQTLIIATDQFGNSADYDLNFAVKDDWSIIKEEALNSKKYLLFNDALAGLETRAKIEKLCLVVELKKE
jgi:surface antigen